MFWHERACPQCTYAKPMFARLADQARETFPDVTFAALDCKATEKICLGLKPHLQGFPEMRFYGDNDHWKKGGAVLDLMAQRDMDTGLKKLIDEWEEALFAFDGAPDEL
jgi:hypothetical protein